MSGNNNEEFRIGIFSTGDLIALSTVLFLTGAAWFQLNALTKSQDRTDMRLANLEQMIPSNYVQRHEYREDIREIKEILRNIESQLDQKADRK